MKFIPIKKLKHTKEKGCWFIFKRSNVRKCPYVLGRWDSMAEKWVLRGRGDKQISESQLAEVGYTHFGRIKEE